MATEVLVVPYPGVPPASPFLASDGDGFRYGRPATMVSAEIRAGHLWTPVPRAAFHAHELRTALDLPEAFDAAWTEANRGAAGPTLAPALGLAWWRYTVGRAALRWSWPSVDIVVPDLLFFARKEGGAATTVLVWPESLRALIVPGAAEHLVLRPETPGAAPALVPRAVFLDALGDRAVEHQGPVPHHLYRGGPAHPAILAALRRAGGEPARGFRAVRADQVVDA